MGQASMQKVGAGWPWAVLHVHTIFEEHQSLERVYESTMGREVCRGTDVRDIQANTILGPTVDNGH